MQKIKKASLTTAKCQREREMQPSYNTIPNIRSPLCCM